MRYKFNFTGISQLVKCDEDDIQTWVTPEDCEQWQKTIEAQQQEIAAKDAVIAKAREALVFLHDEIDYDDGKDECRAKTAIRKALKTIDKIRGGNNG